MAGRIISKVQIGSDVHLISSSLYGTCDTAAGTAAKIVKISNTNINGFDPETGGILAVKFTNSNSIANPTLTIQTSGGTQLVAAKNIYRYGTTAPSTSASSSWNAGSVVLFVYDGSYWQMTDWLNNNDNTVPTVYIGTAADTQAKVGTMTNGALATGYYVCSIVNSNTYNGKITLNINGKGAKDIYINGTVSSSTNKTLNAGSYIAYYNGTAFYFRNDGKIPKLIDSGSLTVSTGAAATVGTGASVTVTAGTAASLTTSSYTVTPVTSKTVVTSATMPSMYILPATTGSVPTAGLDCLYINSGSVSTGASITTGTAQTIKGVNVFTANSPTKVTSKTVVTAVTPATVVTAVSNA